MREYGAVTWSKNEYLLSSLNIMDTGHGDIVICPKLLPQLCKPVVPVLHRVIPFLGRYQWCETGIPAMQRMPGGQSLTGWVTCAR